MTNAAVLPSHLLPKLHWNQELRPELRPTGVDHLDDVIEGCPRGRITEIVGPVSSGRTTLLCSILAEATRGGEFCAVVDTTNSFDPASAEAAGVNLRRLVWIRCNGNAEHAIKSADLLVHSGGFGLISLDLCDAPARITRRIPLSWWYRFRRAVENTPCVFLVMETEPTAKACASLLLEMKRDGTSFRGTRPFHYLDHARFNAAPRKPLHHQTARFDACALR
jgi:hypothetical protein